MAIDALSSYTCVHSPLIPYIENQYRITYTIVSTIFISQCAGYIFGKAAQSTSESWVKLYTGLLPLSYLTFVLMRSVSSAWIRFDSWSHNEQIHR